jgi:hypothetical protein
MMHREALNKLLENCCPTNDPAKDTVGDYVFTMHCADMVVKAVPLGKGKYYIISVEHM